jgi:hypothetical protein
MVSFGSSGGGGGGNEKSFFGNLIGKVGGLSGNAISGGIKAIGSLFGGRRRRRREKAARKAFQNELSAYRNMEITNPYDNLENPYEELRNELSNLEVSTEAADFQAQQRQQSLAQGLDAFRGAAGGTGVASLAQALAQEQRKSMQGIAADIAKQETMNTRLQAQGAQQLGLAGARAGVDLQKLEGMGATEQQRQQIARQEGLMGITAGEYSAASKARSDATSALTSGLGKMFGGD